MENNLFSRQNFDLARLIPAALHSEQKDKHLQFQIEPGQK
jgi:hypothetical protein